VITGALQAGALVPPSAGAPPLLGLLQGQDNPFGNLLGYVIVFMVVVWPIIRGVIESANEKRQEFERGQARQARAKNRSGTPPGRRSLEEILRGDPYVEALQEPEELSLEDLREPPHEQASASRVPSAESAGMPASDAPGPRSRLEGANPALRPSERELVGDPFDDSIMGQDLVNDDALQDVPTEDELEVSIDTSAAGRGKSLGSRDDRGTGASSEPQVATGSGSALAHLERRLSPWQRAFVYKEVLGPPAAMHSHDQGRI